MKRTLKDLIVNAKPLQTWISENSKNRRIYINRELHLKFEDVNEGGYLAEIHTNVNEIYYRENYSFNVAMQYCKLYQNLTIISCATGRIIYCKDIDINKIQFTLEEINGSWYIEL